MLTSRKAAHRTHRFHRFLAIYGSLPQDEQRALVEKYLAPLLDSSAPTLSTNALNAATVSQKRHAGMPNLNLRGKKAELTAILEELGKDIKRSFVTEGTSRMELLSESDLWISAAVGLGNVRSWFEPARGLRLLRFFGKIAIRPGF